MDNPIIAIAAKLVALEERLAVIEEKRRPLRDEMVTLDEKADLILEDIELLNSQIALAKSVADYYEEKISDAADYRKEAIGQFHISGRTDADIKTLCEQSVTELPEELEQAEQIEQGEIENIAASG